MPVVRSIRKNSNNANAICWVNKLKILIGLAVGGLLAALLFVWLGVFNVAATEKHWGITTQILETVRERSIAVRAQSIDVPPLGLPEQVRRGAKNYAAMCAQCHLAPGMEPTELNLGLYPTPPRFFEAEHSPHDPAATFWTIKNGLKLTGMPAWGAFHSDQQIWQLVSFVDKLPALSKQDYLQLVGNGSHTHKGGEQAHEDDPGTHPMKFGNQIQGHEH